MKKLEHETFGEENLLGNLATEMENQNPVNLRLIRPSATVKIALKSSIEIMKNNFIKKDWNFRSRKIGFQITHQLMEQGLSVRFIQDR